MLAAVLTRPGFIEIRETEQPEPSDGELVVKVKAALTCGTDLKAFLRGHALIPMPGPFGHEFSGIVTARGKNTKFKIGDAVMGVHSAPCHACAYCKRGIYNLCDNLMSTKVLGAFSEYLLIPRHIAEQNVFRKPASLNFREAAFLEPLSCVVHSIEHATPGKKDTVFIIGAGPIGLLHLLLAKSRGARVLITGLEGERLRLAQKLGADRIFNPADADEAVHEATEGMGVDYVFECTGKTTIWENSVNYVRKGGTIILFGGCKSGTSVTYDTAVLHYNELTLKGVFHYTPDDVKKAFRILKSGKLPISKLISGTFPLHETAEAFQRLIKGEGIKFVIQP